MVRPQVRRQRGGDLIDLGLQLRPLGIGNTIRAEVLRQVEHLLVLRVTEPGQVDCRRAVVGEGATRQAVQRLAVVDIDHDWITVADASVSLVQEIDPVGLRPRPRTRETPEHDGGATQEQAQQHHDAPPGGLYIPQTTHVRYFPAYAPDRSRKRAETGQDQSGAIAPCSRPPMSPSTWRPPLTIMRPSTTTVSTSGAPAASIACVGSAPAVRTVSSRTATRSARWPGARRPASCQPSACCPVIASTSCAGVNRPRCPVASRSSISRARASSNGSIIAC